MNRIIYIDRILLLFVILFCGRFKHAFSQEDNIKIELSVSPAYSHLFFKPVEQIYYYSADSVSEQSFPGSQMFKQYQPYRSTSVKPFNLRYGLLFRCKITEKIWLRTGIILYKLTYENYNEFIEQTYKHPVWQNTVYSTYKKRVTRYIDYPLLVSYNIKNKGKIKYDCSLGLILPVSKGCSSVIRVVNNETVNCCTSSRFSCSVNSRIKLSAGFCMEYMFLKNIGIIIGPAVSYELMKKYKIAKIENILSFELRTGISIK